MALQKEFNETWPKFTLQTRSQNMNEKELTYDRLSKEV